MAGTIGKFVLKKVLKETAANNFGKTDAFFEQTPATRVNHNVKRKFTANKRKLRKALPPGLSQADQETLVKVKRRAFTLDMSLFSFFGLRFGWSSVIGLVPAIGDVIDLLLALMVVRAASEVNLPPAIRSKMLFNIILDFVIGLVPFLGDLADAAYKANTRNAIILEDFLRQRGQENIRQQGIVPPRDMSLPEEYEQQVGLQHSPTSAAAPVHGGHGGHGGHHTTAQGGSVDLESQRKKKSKKSSSRR